MRGAQCNSGEKEAGRPGRARLSRSASPVARRRPGRGVKGIRQAGMPYSVVQCGYTVPRRGRARPQLFVRAQFGRPTGARRVAGDLGRKQRDPARPRRARSHIPGAAKVAVRAVARVAGAPEHVTYATSSSEHWFSSGRKLESSSLLILYGAFAVISF